jgi:hypothetical protein
MPESKVGLQPFSGQAARHPSKAVIHSDGKKTTENDDEDEKDSEMTLNRSPFTPVATTDTPSH